MISIIISLALLSQHGGLTPGDTEAEWLTITTPSFEIHSPQTLIPHAQTIAKNSEIILNRLAEKMRHRPSSSIHVVLMDQMDASNGLSTPLPYNTIYLFAYPPGDGSSLEEYDDWLTLLFTHELTHSIHLDMAGGFNKFLRYIMGTSITPNAAQPQWLLEGLAVHNETEETNSGRNRSSYVRSMIRAASTENQFPSIDRAMYWNHEFPYGSVAYWFGGAFHEYLRNRFGNEKIIDFAHAHSRWVVPGFLNFKTDNIFGTSFHRLWEEWKDEELKFWKSKTISYTPKASVTTPDPQTLLAGQGDWNEDGTTYYASITRNEESFLVAQQFKADGSVTSETLQKGFSASRLEHANESLYYSKMNSLSPAKRFSDIYRFDLKSKKSKAITKGLRLKDPQVIGDEIVAFRTDHYETSLVKFKIPEDADLPLKDLSKIETLYTAKGISSLSGLEKSPDFKRVVFSMRVENQSRDLYDFDLKNKTLKALTSDKYEDFHPQFSKNGQSLYYVSDHELGSTDERVYNIYALDLKSNQLLQMTDLWNGVSDLSVSNQLAFSKITAKGQTLSFASTKSLSSTSLKKEKLLTTQPPILAKVKSSPLTADLQTKPYSVGDTLLPHFWLPLFLFTESESMVGAYTGSWDPLVHHSWSLLGYYLSTPSRPGGLFNYQYSGFSNFSLFAAGGATITDYGTEIGTNGTTNQLYRYFERGWQGALGIGAPLYYKQSPLGISLSAAATFEKRESLLDLPTGLLNTPATYSVGGRAFSPVYRVPESGNFWGLKSSITWRGPVLQSPSAITPDTGMLLELGADYTPKWMGSDFDTLKTTLKGKYYQETFKHQGIAFQFTAGKQWMDALYQRSFLVGGSFGDGLFNAINQRSYPLRGLPAGSLMGEGIVSGSLEYRAPLVRYLPGFGTAPLWFKNLHIAAFSDGAEVFMSQDSRTYTEVVEESAGTRRMRDFSWDDFTMSAGLELRSDISVFYAPPMTFRLGYGKVFFKEGQGQNLDGVDEMYFQLGRSF